MPNIYLVQFLPHICKFLDKAPKSADEPFTSIITIEDLIEIGTNKAYLSILDCFNLHYPFFFEVKLIGLIYFYVKVGQ